MTMVAAELARTTRDLGAAFGGVSLVCSTLVVLSFALFPALRTPGRQLVTWLSVADMLQAAFFVSSAFLIDDDGNAKAKLDERWGACWWLGTFGIFAALATFLWTAAIAMFVFLSVARVGFDSVRGSREEIAARERRRNSIAFAIFHVVAWGYPLCICLVVWASVPNFYAPDDTWCYIPEEFKTLRFLSTYLPLFTCWLFVAALYTAANLRLRTVKRLTPGSARLHGEVQTKLILIPLAFVILRAPGALLRLVEITVGAEWDWLLPIAAVGNASQGIADCLVYVFFTAKCRELFWELLTRPFRRRSAAGVIRSDYTPIH